MCLLTRTLQDATLYRVYVRTEYRARGCATGTTPCRQDIVRVGVPRARHPAGDGQAWRTFQVGSPSLTEVIDLCLTNM